MIHCPEQFIEKEGPTDVNLREQAGWCHRTDRQRGFGLYILQSCECFGSSTAYSHDLRGPERIEAPAAEPEPEKQLPAVPIKKSVTDEYLISLEDGRRYKSLKRHLSGKSLSPDQYRAKWGLPLSYPMVAPNYAKQRSELARLTGLGRKRSEPGSVVEAVPAKPGRPKKD